MPLARARFIFEFLIATLHSLYCAFIFVNCLLCWLHSSICLHRGASREVGCVGMSDIVGCNNLNFISNLCVQRKIPHSIHPRRANSIDFSLSRSFTSSNASTCEEKKKWSSIFWQPIKPHTECSLPMKGRHILVCRARNWKRVKKSGQTFWEVSRNFLPISDLIKWKMPWLFKNEILYSPLSLSLLHTDVRHTLNDAKTFCELFSREMSGTHLSKLFGLEFFTHFSPILADEIVSFSNWQKKWRKEVKLFRQEVPPRRPKKTICEKKGSKTNEKWPNVR